MIVLLQFMIFGTRKKERSDDGETGGAGVGGIGGGGSGGQRRRKPAYRYGADRASVYLDPRMWRGTGTDIEAVWLPLEGSSKGEGKENKRVVWEDEEQGELSYGKEAMFLVEEPRHAHC